MGAADQGNVEIAKLLLDAKEDIDAKDYAGGTALHWASGKGHRKFVEFY